MKARLGGHRTRGCESVLALLLRCQAAIALGCMAAIMLLHGHNCSGHDCALCVLANLCQVLLCTSCGATLLLPVLKLVAGVQMLYALPMFELADSVAVTGICRVAETPITNKVKLLI